MRTRGDTIEYRPRLDITDSLALESDIVFGTRYISKKRNSAPSKVYKANIPPQNFAPKLKKWEKRKAREERIAKAKAEETAFWDEINASLIVKISQEEMTLIHQNKKKYDKKHRSWERSQKKR